MNPDEHYSLKPSAAERPGPALPAGIVAVVQTPFGADGGLDQASLRRLLRDAVAAGVDGLLLPAAASEVSRLSAAEREESVTVALEVTAGRVPVILGASAGSADASIEFARGFASRGVVAYLVAVPEELYARDAAVVEFFRRIGGAVDLPLIVQDLQFNGPGLPAATIARLRTEVPSLAGFKIETAPAGPKYTWVRELCGPEIWLAGGWAVPQMIEALDRGVDAMVPEASMIRAYRAILDAHRNGDRARAQAWFRRLLPVLAFTNQELSTSVAFFKRLLVRKGIFAGASQRLPLAGWDATSERLASALIEYYLTLEGELTQAPEGLDSPRRPTQDSVTRS